MDCRAFYAGTALLGLTLSSFACGSSDDDDDGCVPNRSVQCAGPNGCVGHQVCQPDGLGYGTCICGDDPSKGSSLDDDDDQGGAGTGGRRDTGGGSPGDSSGAEATSSGGRAGGGDDVGAGGASAGNSGSISTGGGVEPAEPCDPADMSDWTAPAYVPAYSAQQVCSRSDIELFVADCLLGATCTRFEVNGEKAECGACLWPSLLGDDEWGPVVELSPKPFYRYDVNVAGCVELGGEVECAHKIQAAQTCPREACLASCGATSAAFSDCVTAARGGVCASQQEEAVCIMDPELAARCSGTSFEDLVVQLGEVFCGNGK